MSIFLCSICLLTPRRFVRSNEQCWKRHLRNSCELSQWMSSCELTAGAFVVKFFDSTFNPLPRRLKVGWIAIHPEMRSEMSTVPHLRFNWQTSPLTKWPGGPPPKKERITISQASSIGPIGGGFKHVFFSTWNTGEMIQKFTTAHIFSNGLKQITTR